MEQPQTEPSDDLDWGSIITVMILFICYRRANRLIQTGISLPLQDTPSRPARSFRDSGSFAPADGANHGLLSTFNGGHDRYTDDLEIDVDEDAEELREGGPATWGRSTSEYRDDDFAEEDARELGEVRKEDVVVNEDSGWRNGVADTEHSQAVPAQDNRFTLMDVEDEPEGLSVNHVL
ncbi:hypothetical protein BC936DRAFT_140635 [Jimgerdemannia flammicorona]|uniref:Uncharacterized protein n=1 Tax=Jimgerdemannia flammicorona TaxID=994334 RepID=A0A433AI70_9FUNG|nr:hypothetical protein BC936DRAFT_140635 [Jimgerdemannia flammicorona]